MDNLQNRPPTEDSEILALNAQDRAELLWQYPNNHRLIRLIGRTGTLNLVYAFDDDGETIVRGEN